MRRSPGRVTAPQGARHASDEAIARHVDQLQSQTRKKILLCPGGETRAHSVFSALRAVPSSHAWVAIHDAARPLLLPDVIDRTLAAAVEHGAAAPALPVHLTTKQADGPLPAKVQRTVARNTLWSMQTPQIARRDELLDAFFQHLSMPWQAVAKLRHLLVQAGELCPRSFQLLI